MKSSKDDSISTERALEHTANGMAQTKAGPSVSLVFLCLCSSLSFCNGMANTPSGEVKGYITDVRLQQDGRAAATNLLSFSGFYDGGRFLISVTPESTEDEIEETIGWNGDSLYLIQRFPEAPRKGLPRDQSIAYIEPSIFSRYATHATAALLMALADSNMVATLNSTTSAAPILLGTLRQHPEEDNRYTVEYTAFRDWSVKAICPPFRIGPDGKKALLDAGVYTNGFLRWRFATRNSHQSDAGAASDFNYERFRPKYQAQRPKSSDDLIKERHITGSISLKDAPRMLSDFRPSIKEASLPVLDFRGRKDFVDANKSYEKDYHVLSVSTNASWENAEMLAIKGAAVTELGIKAVRENQARHSKFRSLFYLSAGVLFALPLVLALKRSANKQGGARVRS